MTAFARAQATEAVPTDIVLGVFDPTRSDPLHDVIRAARLGQPDAVRLVMHELRSAVPSTWGSIVGVVVPVPGHLPGPANRLVSAAARHIADLRGWTCADDALERRLPSTEGKGSTMRDVRAESETLAWRPARDGDTIVLVDDVVRTGSTLAACVDAIRRAGDDRPIVAIVLAAAVR